MPELFNFTLVLCAYFLWTLQAVAAPPGRKPGLRSRRGSNVSCVARSDYAAAVLLGIATFSKPTHVAADPADRRAGARSAANARRFSRCGVPVRRWSSCGLFGAQRGDHRRVQLSGRRIRKSFYSRTGFPFANDWETFDNRGAGGGHRRGAVRHPRSPRHGHGAALEVVVLRGRPIQRAAAVFLSGAGGRWIVPRRRDRGSSGSGSSRAALAVGGRRSAVLHAVHVLGRRRADRQPLLPELLSAVPVPDAAAAQRCCRSLPRLAIGALFTAKLVLNPFYTSFNPGEHAKAGPLRMLPIELTLLNDLPVSADADRARRTLGGHAADRRLLPRRRRLHAGRGGVLGARAERADIILRAPVSVERRTGDFDAAAPVRWRSANGRSRTAWSLSARVGRQTVELARWRGADRRIQAGRGRSVQAGALSDQLHLHVLGVDRPASCRFSKRAAEQRQPLSRRQRQTHADLLRRVQGPGSVDAELKLRATRSAANETPRPRRGGASAPPDDQAGTNATDTTSGPGGMSTISGPGRPPGSRL